MLYALKHATTTTARVWARWPAGGAMSVLCNGVTHGLVPLDAAADYSGVVEVSGLSAGTSYPFSVLVDGVARASGVLRTMPTPDAAFVIGFVSCLAHNRAAAPLFALQEHFGSELVAFCFQGDFPYLTASAGFTGTISGFGESFQDIELCGNIADEATVKANAYAHHRYWWQIPGAKEMLRSVPCYFVSDDHERPSDNWDYTIAQANAFHPGTFSTQQQVNDMGRWCREVMGVYYAGNPENADANRDTDFPTDQQLYYDFVVGDVHVICLESIEYAGGGATYGATQVAWLKSRLLSSTQTFKIINSGKGLTEFQASLPAEYSGIYDYIATNSISGVVWLSGDIHCMGVREDLVTCVRGGPGSQDHHANVPNGYPGNTTFKEWGHTSIGAPGGAIGAVGFVRVTPRGLTVGMMDSRGAIRWSRHLMAGTNALSASGQKVG